MKNKIKNWLRNVINSVDNLNDDINIDIAKANYQKYQDGLKQRQKEYIKTLCQKIKLASINGSTFVDTVDTFTDFMTRDFIKEIKEYFEERGFHVTEQNSSSGVVISWLRISWK